MNKILATPHTLERPRGSVLNLVKRFESRNGTDLSSKDLSSPDSSQRLPHAPFITIQAMVSTELFEQFESLLNQYKKKEDFSEKRGIFRNIVRLLERHPNLFQEKPALSSLNLTSLSTSTFIEDKKLVYQFVELILDRFIKHEEGINFVQKIWKNDLFLTELSKFEHELLNQDASNFQTLLNSLKGIKTALLVIGLTPMFSFETLGVPDQIGIGSYTVPSDDLYSKQVITHSKKWILSSSFDLNSFQLIYLRQELGILDSETLLKEFYEKFLTDNISQFLEAILSSSKKENLNQLFLNFIDPKSLSSIEVYKTFTSGLTMFLDPFFKETQQDARLRFMFEKKPLDFIAHFLIAFLHHSDSSSIICKVLDKILLRTHCALDHLDHLEDYTKDKETLHYILCLADAFLSKKLLWFDLASARLKSTIQKFLDPKKNDLHEYCNKLQSEPSFKFREVLKETILTIAKPNFSPMASRILRLQQFKESLPGKFGLLFSNIPLYALIPFFVKGVIDGLAQECESTHYLIQMLSEIYRNYSHKDYSKQDASVCPYQEESLQILKQIAKTGLPELRLSDSKLAQRYQDIKDCLQEFLSSPHED